MVVALSLDATFAAAAAVASTSAVASANLKPLMRQEIIITFRQVVKYPTSTTTKCLSILVATFPLIFVLVCSAIKIAAC